MVRFALPALLLSLVASSAFAAESPDGEQVFNQQCKMCHSGPSTALAPSLAGVAGAKIAGRDDFTYSDALKAKSSDTWTDSNLDSFLADPQTFSPGTKMFVSPQPPEARSALINYLKLMAVVR